MIKNILKKMMEKEGFNYDIHEEYRFHNERRWRFDYAIPEIKLAIEIEGGAYVYGRHCRPIGYLNDLEKYNTATELGWRILRYPPSKIDFDQIVRVVKTLSGKN